MLRQILNTATRAGASRKVRRELLRGAAELFGGMDLSRSPAFNSTRALKTVPERTGCRDPYADEKREYNSLALALRPHLESVVEGARDRLLTAAMVAVAGNAIDLGIARDPRIDVAGSLRDVLEAGFAVNDIAGLRAALAPAPKSQTILAGGELRSPCAPAVRVMYLADNAGEIVFDRELVRVIAESGSEVTVAVHGGPILNDALAEDAARAGMGEIARITSTGSDWVGLEWDTCDPGFRDEFARATVVIAKGQGYYETLGEDMPVCPEETYFILKAKCPAVARSLGVRTGQAALFRRVKPARRFGEPGTRDL
jgi:hypothetical protein